MISFRPTEEEIAFAQTARTFAKEQIRPVARECEQARSLTAKVTQEAINLGFTALELPESMDGLELPMVSQVQVMEALAYGDLAVVQGFPGPGDAASVLRVAGSSAAISSYLQAHEVSPYPTVAFIDAGQEWQQWDCPVRVVKESKGYVINGTYRPVRLAQSAEFMCLAARDSDQSPVVLWLNRGDTPWEVLPGDIRLGLLASGLGSIRFEQTRVSAQNVLAQGAAAEELLSKALVRIRVLEAAKETGLMQAALEYAVNYTATRKAFGQEIAKFQGVSFVAADMAMELQAARNLTLRAAALIDQESQDQVAASLRALAKAHQAVRFVTNNAVQLLGGHGFVQDHPVEKWMRDAQAQVMVYGRESELMLQRGELLLPRSQEQGVQA
ncbi:acyl-CoA dehydrogenase family protein [Alicyclobacillus tolerans]|uniref:acyl-CoA dehydrogenase family protein n=1 Tax=Alicyclobacillus tolerans TaxID=90970 RepID=UPI001F2F4555|nr:acyl-CoA dehydrogenase family protein [Alicyclobacillus tolerans]MCF8566941.1 acyl-CoA dehydrogenase family protein [Alicyclobacillus tolerans]